MGLLILCGIAFRALNPSRRGTEWTRHALLTLVYYLLFPCLILSVLWRAEVGAQSLKISLFGTIITLLGTGLAWLLTRWLRARPERTGAMLLGIGFPNVTYMGLPVLEQTFGEWARAIVIQIDLFALTPLVLTLGALIAQSHGSRSNEGAGGIWRSLVYNPPLWVAGVAVGLNLGRIEPAGWLLSWLDRLADAAAPLMLIALGLALRWDTWRWELAPPVLAAAVLRLALLPLIGWSLAAQLDVSNPTQAALVLEAGMPSMLLGVVYCERYRLDTHYYAMLATVTTALSMLSLPLWHFVLVAN